MAEGFRDLPNWREVELLADAFRKRHPQDAPPLDIERLAHIAGIDQVAVSDRITGSGLLVAGPAGTHGILLNRHDSPWRQRFTVAHEIAHKVLHPDRSAHELVVEVAARRYRAPWRRRTPLEMSCDHFAACLLMPRAWIVEAARDAPSARYLATLFGVSVEAMKLRLKECGENRLAYP